MYLNFINNLSKQILIFTFPCPHPPKKFAFVNSHLREFYKQKQTYFPIVFINVFSLIKLKCFYLNTKVEKIVKNKKV